MGWQEPGVDQGQGCGSVRGGTEDGIHPIYTKSSLLVSCSLDFQHHHLNSYVTLGMPHSWHFDRRLLDGPTVGRRATNRAIFYDNMISHWKCISLQKKDALPTPSFFTLSKNAPFLITDLHALKTHWTSYARASSQL